MFGPRTYTAATQSYFDEVATLFINLASLNAATESFANASSTKIPNSPEHTLNLYGSVAHACFPIHSLMHGLIRNEWPQALPLVLLPNTTRPSAIPNGIELQSDAIANLIVQLVGSAYLKYYERSVGRVRAAHPGNPMTWPELWRFAWLLRNAIAHGDRWKLNNASFPPTTWHGVTVSPQDNSQPWFNVTRYVGGGDVLLLLEELEQSVRSLPPEGEA